MALIVVLFFILTVNARPNNKATVEDTIFKDYLKGDRPVESDDEIFSVNVWLIISNIVEFDIIKGALRSELILVSQWNDYRLTWNNTANNTQIDYLNVELSKIWYPTIQICNSVSGKFTYDEDEMEATLLYNGNVYLYIDRMFNTYCRINTNKYPFDEHECDLTVCMDHQMNKEETIGEFEHEVTYNSTSNQWDFTIVEVELSEKDIITAGVIVHARRKVTSGTVTKIIPPIMLTLLILSVYFLPAESGEKVSVAITIFLANVVYLSEIEKMLGQNSREPSIYLIYLLILALVSGLSSIGCIIVCKLYVYETTTNTNSAVESGSKNKIGIMGSSDEQNVKVQSTNSSKKYVLTSKKLDMIFLLVTVMFLLLYIIIASSSSF